MSFQISFQLYKWLVHLKIVSNNQRYKPSGNIQLQQNIHQQLLSGFLIPQILSKLAADSKIDINQPLINSVKKSKSMAARIYNWNILSQVIYFLEKGFNKLGINISKQAQKQITNGNFNVLQRILLETNKKFNQQKKNDELKTQLEQNSQIDFKRLQSFQYNYQKCQTFLQIIIMLISNTCKFSLKQSYATLSQNCKYLSHMIVKGIKGSYQEIVNLFRNFVSQTPQIMFQIEKDPAKNTAFMLQILKPSLISRDADVTLQGCKSFKAFVYESLKYNEKNIVYQILTSQNMGFDFLYMGIKRHPDLAIQINQFLFPLIEHSFYQFFEVQLKKTINNEQQYIKILIYLLQGIVSQQQSKKKLIDSGLLQLWVKNCQNSFNSKKNKQFTSINDQTKIFYLQLLCDLWKAYSKQLNQQLTELLMMKGIQQLKKNTRIDIYTVKIPALIRLFDFLDYLAINKNKMAAIIYKKIIFLFVENHQQNQMRQLILDNFSTIIKKFSSIPLEFLLQPLLKQLTAKQGTTYILNMYDFNFMIQVFKHPKMQAAYALNFLEYFSKLYIKNIIYSSLIIRIISLLSSRYCQEQAIIQYIKKNVQSNLNSYGMLVIGKRKKGTKDQKIIDNQKKSLIIQLIKLFIRLESMTLNEIIEKMVVKLYVYWKDEKNYVDKGLQYLLNEIGNIDQICLNQRNRKKQKGSILQEYIQQNKQILSHRPHLRVQSLDSQPKSRLIYDQFNKNEQIYLLKQILPKSQIKKNKFQQILQKKQIKPDPRTLQDLEKIKQKIKREKQRKQNNQFQKKNLQLNQSRQKINSIELLHRNLSLGYTKLPDINFSQMLFDFDSVKTKQLKQSKDFIQIQFEQVQDKITTEHVFKQYQKYIRAIFNKFAYATTNKQNPLISDHKLVLTFTQIMRMLKEKNMNTVQKLTISEVISYINRKYKVNRNILGGLQQKQFEEFLVIFTDLYTKQQNMSQDIPFGCKLQKVIKLLLVNQSIGKQFTDNKIIKWSKDFKITNNENLPVPQGYKKTKLNQINLIYTIGEEQSGINNSFLDCFEILNQIFQDSLNIGIFPPLYQIKEIYKIIPITIQQKYKIPQLLTQKNLKRPFQSADNKDFQANSEQNQLKLVNQIKKNKYQNKIIKKSKSKSHKILNKNKTQINLEQQKRKIQLQQQYSIKLKAQLQQLKAKRAIKQGQQQQKKKQIQEKNKKKQQEHRKYLEKNKQKIQIQKQKEDQQKKNKQIQDNQAKQKHRLEIKKKQLQLLQRQKDKIKKISQKVQERKKQKNKLIQNKFKVQKEAQIQVDSFKNQKDQDKQKEKILMDSLYNSQHEIYKITQKFEKQITELFQAYWNWQKKKIELSGIAHMFKDFQISPQFISPKLISEVYKITSKGLLLDLNNFRQILVKYAYKSQKLQQNCAPLSGQILEKLFTLMKMKEKNYTQIIKLAKLHQL